MYTWRAVRTSPKRQRGSTQIHAGKGETPCSRFGLICRACLALRQPKTRGFGTVPKEVATAEPSTVLGRQLCTQCVHNLPAILSPLFLENILVDARADAPVQADERGIDSARCSDFFRAASRSLSIAFRASLDRLPRQRRSASFCLGWPAGDFERVAARAEAIVARSGVAGRFSRGIGCVAWPNAIHFPS